jgi:hypothetical protein
MAGFLSPRVVYLLGFHTGLERFTTLQSLLALGKVDRWLAPFIHWIARQSTEG